MKITAIKQHVTDFGFGFPDTTIIEYLKEKGIEVSELRDADLAGPIARHPWETRHPLPGGKYAIFSDQIISDEGHRLCKSVNTGLIFGSYTIFEWEARLLFVEYLPVILDAHGALLLKNSNGWTLVSLRYRISEVGRDDMFLCAPGSEEFLAKAKRLRTSFEQDEAVRSLDHISEALRPSEEF